MFCLECRPIILFILKGALDKCNIIPPTFSKKNGIFYISGSVGMSNNCILSFTF